MSIDDDTERFDSRQAWRTVGDVLDRDELDSLPNHDKTNHGDDMIERLDALERGESLYDSYSGAWKRLVPSEPSPTIKGNHGAPFVHPHEPRVGTPRECALLQDFPDTFVFEGSKSAVLTQIGNAVPVGLGEAVASSMMDELSASMG